MVVRRLLQPSADPGRGPGSEPARSHKSPVNYKLRDQINKLRTTMGVTRLTSRCPGQGAAYPTACPRTTAPLSSPKFSDEKFTALNISVQGERSFGPALERFPSTQFA